MKKEKSKMLLDFSKTNPGVDEMDKFFSENDFHLRETENFDFGTCYPLVDFDSRTKKNPLIMGVVCSEFRTDRGAFHNDGDVAWLPEYCEKCGDTIPDGGVDIDNECTCE